jgi:hypothetical protein
LEIKSRIGLLFGFPGEVPRLLSRSESPGDSKRFGDFSGEEEEESA